MNVNTKSNDSRPCAHMSLPSATYTCSTTRHIKYVNNNSVALVRSRPSDRRLTVKLVPTLADRGMSSGQRDGSLQP
jgi:hypothetical protein